MKKPTYVWKFKSSSGSGTYETIQYNDMSVSCSCPGWCRRVSADGSRTCKHQRSVELGDANSESFSHGPVGAGGPVAADVKTTKVPKQSVFGRKFV